MNTKMILGGAVALSFAFAVGSASADDDPMFDTTKTEGAVTQTVTATFDAHDVSYKFFTAKIEFTISEGQEE